MKTNTLIFDLDGTLSDPSRGIIECVNHALKSCNHAVRSEAEICAEIGPPLDLMFGKFIPNLSPDLLNDLVRHYREKYTVDGFSANTPYTGVAETLEQLHNANLQLGVCTSKPEQPARRILEHFGFLKYFRFVSGGDIGVAKQSQLQQLLENQTIDHTAIMIGDRGVDLSAAHNNGLRAVAALWGFGSKTELLAHQPELLLDDVNELLTHFASE